ncbi:MAG: chloride channel protein [Theionarchaea archaeon]|nr:chloride channel protein [Theionarchaea archaeon]MBU7037193.1 chloride channel protein [Theionarchaea archaeon]
MPELPEEPRLPSRRELEQAIWSVMIAICVVPVVYSFSLLVRERFSLIQAAEPMAAFPYHWWLVFICLGGGAVVGLIIWKIAPESEGPGLQVVIAAFNKRDGHLRTRTGASKYVATLITVGSGTPNGIVSPSAVLGNSVASMIGRIGNTEKDRDLQKTLSLCGVSAALSTLLGAPVGAALFAVEVVYGNYILYRRFFYCLISSVTAHAVTHFLGMETAYFDITLPELSLTGYGLFLVILTALFSVMINIGYISVYQRIHDFFSDLSHRMIPWLVPAVGMGLAALIMVPLYQKLIDFSLLGGSAFRITAAAAAPWYVIAVLIVVIVIATSLVAGSGGSGGLFMPVMTVGVLTGILVGNAYPPFIFFFIVAGMSAALCTTLNVPLASAVLGIELFGPPAILPSIIGALTGYIFAKRYVIYHEIQWEALKESDQEKD